MNPAYANSTVTVDLRVIGRNVEKIRRHMGVGVEFMATAKSNGYGHGLVEPVRYLRDQCGVEKFATAMVSEALTLREAGIDGFVMVLGGIPYGAIPAVIEHDLVVPAYDSVFLRELSRQAVVAKKSVQVHIKVETGLRRLGVRPGDELSQLLDLLEGLAGIEVGGVYSHLANPMAPDQVDTNAQLDLFDEAIAQITERGIEVPLRHIANSDAVARSPRSYYTLVRPAALWLGYHDDGLVGVEPAITWQTFVADIREVEAGQTISYFGNLVMDRPRKVAILGFGSGDGYVRNLISPDPAKNGIVIIGGHRVPLLAMNMDQAYADITGVPDVARNDPAYLLKHDGPITLGMEELARIAGTSIGHIQTSLSYRPQRIYLR